MCATTKKEPGIAKLEAQAPNSRKERITPKVTQGFVYGPSNDFHSSADQSNEIGQAEKVATMPVPFETLIPYGIMIAVSSDKLAAVVGSGR